MSDRREGMVRKLVVSTAMILPVAEAGGTMVTKKEGLMRYQSGGALSLSTEGLFIFVPIMWVMLTVAGLAATITWGCMRSGKKKNGGIERKMQQKDVGSQSMVTYRRKWATPKFDCLPEAAHG